MQRQRVSAVRLSRGRGAVLEPFAHLVGYNVACCRVRTRPPHECARACSCSLHAVRGRGQPAPRASHIRRREGRRTAGRWPGRMRKALRRFLRFAPSLPHKQAEGPAAKITAFLGAWGRGPPPTVLGHVRISARRFFVYYRIEARGQKNQIFHCRMHTGTATG